MPRGSLDLLQMVGSAKVCGWGSIDISESQHFLCQRFQEHLCVLEMLLLCVHFAYYYKLGIFTSHFSTK